MPIVAGACVEIVRWDQRRNQVLAVEKSVYGKLAALGVRLLQHSLALFCDNRKVLIIDNILAVHPHRSEVELGMLF